MIFCVNILNGLGQASYHQPCDIKVYISIFHTKFDDTALFVKNKDFPHKIERQNIKDIYMTSQMTIRYSENVFSRHKLRNPSDAGGYPPTS